MWLSLYFNILLFKVPDLEDYFLIAYISFLLRYISKKLGYDKNNVEQMVCLWLCSQS